MAQSLATILVHLIFSTKFREPLINPKVEPNLHAYLSGIFRQCKCPSLIIGGMPDHIHALFSLHRTWAVADLVEEVKKNSSKWMKTNGKEYQHFQWQGGYGAFSVSQSAVQEVKEYIANQKYHHRKMTFQDEFRALLKKYEGIERYLCCPFRALIIAEPFNPTRCVGLMNDALSELQTYVSYMTEIILSLSKLEEQQR